ncbi:serine hydrolase [Lewinellaceae bacterium SD302]|nr:serine hydrolase [Lewinellaceae bacterium SD302]
MRHLFLISSLLLAGFLTAQSAADIRAAAKKSLATFDAPGFSVGVIKDGKVVISEGFGVRTKGESEPVDGNTLFAIASNTKAFISTAIAKLHEEGKLDMDAPVRRYLPYFQLYDEYVSEHTTVRDLLCHRVGLGTFSGDAIWYKSEKSAEEIVRQIRHLPQAYSWRGGYGYTNLMFITAGEVIRSVTGMGWEEYVRQQFFAPLEMNRSQTGVEPLANMSNVATPHVSYRDNEPISMAPWGASGAAGGIISSSNDMLKWLHTQLEAGTVEGQVIFPAKVQDHTFRPHNTYGGPLRFSTVGLGWFIYEREGQAVVTHGGGYDGMYSRVILLPEEEVGIVILSNSMTGLTSALGSHLRDLYLGMETSEDWLEKAWEGEVSGREKWNSRQKEIKLGRVSGITKPTVSESELSGNYRDPLFGDFKVARLATGDLELQFSRSNALNAKLEHFHHNTYRLLWNEPHAWFDFGTVQFLTNNRNQVTGLQFDVPNDDIFFEELHPVKVR